MHQFLAQHQEQIVGVLSGFDRVVFRGTLRPIAYAEGMRRYLRATHVRLKDFGRHVEEVSSAASWPPTALPADWWGC